MHSNENVPFAWKLGSEELVVEVDGPSHLDRPPTERYDAGRERFLLENGWAVLRFTNSEVFESVEDVLNEIRAACDLRVAELGSSPDRDPLADAPSDPLRGPPPPRGEEVSSC
jgi:hypothetical protein